MDKRVTPPKRVTSPTWGSPPPCKQALKSIFTIYITNASSYSFTPLGYFKDVSTIWLKNS